MIHVTNRAVAQHHNIIFDPVSAQTLPEPVPNAIAWPGRMYPDDHDLLTAVWEEYLGFGFNTLPLGNPWLTGPSDNETMDNVLQVQEELGGIPIQIEYSFGYTHWWDGTYGPKIYREGDPGDIDDPGEASHYPNYHTNVEAAFIAGGSMEAVIDANVGVPESGNYASAVSYLHCPHSNHTSAYINALAQLNEYCRLLKPVAVWIDTEKYQSANYVDPIIKTAIASAAGLSGCSRCGSHDGYKDGTNAVYRDICRVVRTHSPNAAILSYTSVWDNVTPRSDQRFCELGRDKSEIIIGSPYADKTCQEYGVAPRTVYTSGYGTRIREVLRNLDPSLPGNLRNWQATQLIAINESYFQVPHHLDIADFNRGYAPPEAIYDLCQFLASEGAYGFSMYPGWGGKEKDPSTFPPNTASYTAEEVARDAAAKLIYTAGIKSFRAYFANNPGQRKPLPVF